VSDGCQSWYYASRYRQYVVEVSYFGPNQPIRPEQFEATVANLMNETEAAFGSGR
jgi:hypothetical protein